MDKNQFAAFLACALLPMVVQEIQKHTGENAIEVLEKFYHSKVYEILENESSKLWHLSPLTLCNMYKSEVETGNILFPEEA